MANYSVIHSRFGSGIVKRIYGSRIDIDFYGNMVSMVFPGAFSTGLSTSDPELLALVGMALKKVTLQEHSEIGASKTDVLKLLSEFSFGFISSRCKSLPFSTNEELFEVIGYLAKPTVLDGIWAEIPQSVCSDFKSMFAEETIMPITEGTTESGAPNKFGVQCRLNLRSVDNCPELIKLRLAKGLGKAIVNRLNNTLFALQMVKFFGFHFGNTLQDYSKIKAIASDYGYLDSFIKGYNR